MKEVNVIIGIDPGGGLAISTFGNVRVVRMPENVLELRDEFVHLRDASNGYLIAFIEKVSARHDDMQERGKIFNIQKMLNSYNRLLTLLELEKIPYILVHPRSWQSYNGLYQHRENEQDVIEAMNKNLSSRSESGMKTTLEQFEKMKQRIVKRIRKARYAADSQDKFPDIKVTLWNADALQLLLFGINKINNDESWVKPNLPKEQKDIFF